MRYMRDLNKKYTYNHIETKIMFMGFILGIIPFLILLLVVSPFMEYSPNLFINTIIVFGIVTSISNSFVLLKLYQNKKGF